MLGESTCGKPSLKKFKCRIELADRSMVVEDIKVCSEHEKAFEALYGKGRNFVN